MENNNNDKKSAAQKAGGLLFAGCLFIGMAAGWYFSDIKIGLFGGMGIGFVVMAIVVMSAANKK